MWLFVPVELIPQDASDISATAPCVECPSVMKSHFTILLGSQATQCRL